MFGLVCCDVPREEVLSSEGAGADMAYILRGSVMILAVSRESFLGFVGFPALWTSMAGRSRGHWKGRRWLLGGCLRLVRSVGVMGISDLSTYLQELRVKAQYLVYSAGKCWKQWPSAPYALVCFIPVG